MVSKIIDKKYCIHRIVIYGKQSHRPEILHTLNVIYDHYINHRSEVFHTHSSIRSARSHIRNITYSELE